MKILADYHTHTIYSHGKGTIEDNIKAALKLGIKTLGISDHGHRHLTYGVKYDDIKKMREQIDLLNEKYTDINILLGIEANILDENGQIDVDDNLRKYFDYVMAGYHFGSLPTHLLKGAFHHMGNYIKPFRPIYKEYNTRALINAMKTNDLFALTHPGSKGQVDIIEIAKVSIQTNTALEISSRHSHLNVEEINLIKDMDVKFIISSDAHKPQEIGDFAKAIKRVKETGLDPSKIINIEGLVD